MRSLRVAPIVEGQGEVAALPLLLRRLWSEELAGGPIEVLKPVLAKRVHFENEQILLKRIGLAANKLKYALPAMDRSLVLIVFDRDPSPLPPCLLGPQALAWSRRGYAHLDAACVVANVEYETWFAAGAASLGKYLQLSPGESPPTDPEGQRCGKKWIEDRFRGTKYSETQDQPRLTSALDLQAAIATSPSFAKLHRELQARL